MIRFLSVVLALNATLPQPLPKSLPAKVRDRVAAQGEQLLQLKDCEFLVQLFDPKDDHAAQWGFCLYPLKVEQGIFVHTTCVGVLVEPMTGSRNALYGKDGHWGVEGACETASLKKKFLDPEINKTINPITAFRQKRKDGNLLRPLVDRLHLWETFDKLTK